MIEKLETAVRQEQIAQAVLKLIAEQGLEGVRVSAVAKEIGVVPSALYRHFANKEKMIQSALDAVWAAVSQVADEIARRTDNPLKILDLTASEMPRLFKQTLAIPRIVFGPGSGAAQSRVLDYVRDNIQQPLLARVETTIRAEQAAGLIKPKLNPSTLALMYFGMFITAQIRWFVMRGEFDPAYYVREAWKILRVGIVTDKGAKHA